MSLNFNFIEIIKPLKFFIIYIILMELVNSMSEVLNSGLEYVNRSKILSAVLGLFLVLYAALAAPKLPKSVSSLFDNTWFKLGFMFLIAYMSTKDTSVAIIAAVALMVTLQTLSAQKTADAVVRSVENKVEQFGNLESARLIENFASQNANTENELERTKQALLQSMELLNEQKELAEQYRMSEVQNNVTEERRTPVVSPAPSPSANEMTCGDDNKASFEGYEGSEMASF